jgi:hypothetical protein
MELFQLINNKYAYPSTHALLIEPFKSIWESDTSEGNLEAIKILTYVELLCSPKKSNPYFGIPEEQRPEAVKKQVWGDSPPDAENATIIMDAVQTYKRLLNHSSPSFDLYDSAMAAAEKLKAQLKNINFNERTKGGAMVIKPKDVTSALKEIPDVMKSMEQLRNKLNQDLVDEAKTRNDRDIGSYEE